MKKCKNLHSLMRLKAWELEHLPSPDSLVGQRIFLHLIDAYNRGHRKSVKVLCSEVAFSTEAIRVQTRRLQQEGWVSISQGTTDSRQRFLEITQRAKTLIKDYEKQIDRAFK